MHRAHHLRLRCYCHRHGPENPGRPWERALLGFVVHGGSRGGGGGGSGGGGGGDVIICGVTASYSKATSIDGTFAPAWVGHENAYAAQKGEVSTTHNYHYLRVYSFIRW
ncbi:hypothetical protein LIER_43985 [Lithospermum erythrorhizon]|uniref:Uncharacterized protein n=1 Tax=Lithospermum erythrorhizon TaxID=34254 RepID=A0AAV3RKM8_LITER